MRFFFVTICFLVAAMNIAFASDEVRFVPLGDSYTIGEGVAESERWPNQVVALLRSEGVQITLLANPARTGWTVDNALASELPVLKAERASFSSILIGVNDWVQGSTKEEFRKKLLALIDAAQAALPDSRRLVLITIPDFGATPAGARYGSGRDISAGIAEFNTIIAEAAKERGLPLADIYPVSQEAKSRPELVAPDGLHPSGKQYAEWVPIIAAEFRKLMRAAGK